MATFVSADWVEERLDASDILVLDPRRRVRYLQGHLKNAVNLPLSKAFDTHGRLLSVEDLKRWISAAGLGDQRNPVLCDSSDGRDAAMLAWILAYFGRIDVRIMDVFLEKWVAEGREVFYRPVNPVPKEFSTRINPNVRATLKDLCDPSRRKLVDLRSRDEYIGKVETDERPGHIPGAVNIVWQDLLGEDHRFLAPKEKVQRLLAAAGVARHDRIVAYCRTGPRAAVGYWALTELGLDVSLYDGSYLEWARSGLPIEAPEA